LKLKFRQGRLFLLTLKSKREIEGMAHSGAILAAAHQMLKPKLHVGMDTWKLNS
jgi:methionyl aminopeptidase